MWNPPLAAIFGCSTENGNNIKTNTIILLYVSENICLFESGSTTRLKLLKNCETKFIFGMKGFFLGLFLITYFRVYCNKR